MAAYGQAWASRDVDRILALHAEETEFVMHVDGTVTTTTREAVSARFQTILTASPDYASEINVLRLGPNFAVVQYNILSNPVAPVHLGDMSFAPGGAAYRLPAIDVIVFQNGLVTSKHTYLDTETLRRHSAEARDRRKEPAER